jgi:hypothetical protein
MRQATRPGLHGCNADAKKFFYYIMHINLRLESLLSIVKAASKSVW